MDNNIGLHILKDEQQLLVISDVAFVVIRARQDVSRTAEIDRGYAGGRPVLEGLLDDVVAEEAIAADDEDFAERAS